LLSRPRESIVGSKFKYMEQNYKNIDGESSASEVGYNNLLSRDGTNDLIGDANIDNTNAVDLSNGINSNNSGAVIGAGAINIQQTTLTQYAEIFIPAEAMNKTTTAGCSGLTKVEAGTYDVDYWVLDFDATTEESCFFTLRMPDNWDGKTVTFQFIWTNTAGLTTETVVWGVKGRAYADSDAIDQAYGTEVTVTDTWLAQNDIHLTDNSTDVTLGGLPKAGQWCQFKISRKTSIDNISGDARLIGIRIKYKFV